MLFGPRKAELPWEDLPTALIRAVGIKIGFEPWVEFKANPLRNADKLSDAAIYAMLCTFLNYWRERVYPMPLELSPVIPRNFSVEKMADILVRITILIRDGGKLAKDRKKPEHFCKSVVCQLELLSNLAFFLNYVDGLLSPDQERDDFYGRLGIPLTMLAELLESSSSPFDLIIICRDPALLANFRAAFGREIAEAQQARGRRLSREEIEQVVERAIGLAGIVTYSPKPENPADN